MGKLYTSIRNIIHLRIGFSPHEAHAHQAFFGWIMPTIRTSEFTVLQIVGLDAAVVSAAKLSGGSLVYKFFSY